jgi:formylglycine-generating enzyme required for sulfatase activity
VSFARERLGVIALFAAVAATLVALVVALAASRAEPPASCGLGMVMLGARCCGEGQHLEGDRCAGPPRRCAAGMEITAAGCVGASRPVRIEGGLLRVGPGDWEAQGVVTPYQVEVAPFALDSLEVTEQRFAACIAEGACASVPLSGEPGRAISRVTLAEASAFCRWAGGTLPSRDQLAFAAAGRGGRRYAWGDTGAVCRRVAFGLTDGPCGTGAKSPGIAGAHPDGASPEGVLDLAGNVAEWSMPDPPDAPVAEVRGGSFADGAASALRSWQRRVVPVEIRAPEIGFRCAYRAP